MPKLKSHKGLLKRFKVTGSGKIKRRNSFGTHLMSSKNAKRRRGIHSTAIIGGKLGKAYKKDMSV
jgi:large subunit ribosomal protein L35